MGETPEEDLSDEQKAEIQQFDDIAEKRMEQVTKEVNVLKTEMRKIVGEIAEARAKWDGVMDALFATWMESSQGIFEVELWRVRLSHSVLQSEELAIQEDTIRKEMKAKTMQKAAATQAAKAYYRQVDAANGDLQQLLDADKSKEKQFKKDMNDSAEIIDTLLALWKQRWRSGKAPKFVEPEVVADADPWLALEERKQLRADAALVLGEPLDYQLDVAAPETMPISETVWERVAAARDAKIVAEEIITKQRQVVNALARVHGTLSKTQSNASAELDGLQNDLQSTLSEVTRNSTDLEVQVKLKQGQVEVEQAAVVTDYGDALLLPNETVLELNHRIKQSGGAKVGILEEIKAGGKQTAELHWEQKRLVLEAHDLDETTRDFQLMRVNKELQNIIKSGYKNTAAGENPPLESLEVALKTAHAKKLADRQGSYRKLQKQINEKRTANDKLDASIMDASVAVAQREQISAMQKTAADKDGVARRRMKEVVTRRRLLELARAQTDEVDILREELDRLRQRTFPSFHQLQHVAGGMDEL